MMDETTYQPDEDGDDVSQGAPVPPDEVKGTPPDADEETQRADVGDPAFDNEPEAVVAPEGEEAEDTEPEDDTPAPEYEGDEDDEPDDDEAEEDEQPEAEEARLPAEDPDKPDKARGLQADKTTGRERAAEVHERKEGREDETQT